MKAWQYCHHHRNSQLFRVYDKFNDRFNDEFNDKFNDRFNGITFVEYLKKLHWKYGKIAIMLDRASVHKSIKVKEYLAKNPDVKLIWLSKGSPHLNMIE